MTDLPKSQLSKALRKKGTFAIADPATRSKAGRTAEAVDRGRAACEAAPSASRRRRHHAAVRRRERGVDASLSCARLGQVGRRLAGAGAGQAQKVAMLGSLDHVTRQLVVHTSPGPSAARLHRPSERLDQHLRPDARQRRPSRSSWSRTMVRSTSASPAGGPGRSRALAHRRMAAQIRPRVQRHRGRLARPESAYLAHRTFTDIAALDSAIHHRRRIEFNRERMIFRWTSQRIPAQVRPRNSSSCGLLRPRWLSGTAILARASRSGRRARRWRV